MSEEHTKNNSGGNCSGIMQKLLLLDMHGRPFLFKLPNQQQKYKSIVGSLCSVTIIMIVALYAAYKIQLLVDKDEARV